ncbi:MAG TPA: hypothetical protein VFK33_09525 [Bacillales bacterium]|nr:hypothetical protein [Bacillales bacterium]
MAFGIKREELLAWKKKVASGEIAFLTHYWIHPRYPECTTVTKAGCSDVDKLVEWGRSYGLKKEWMDRRANYPHFDLIGDKQIEILQKEGLSRQLERFHIC